MEKSSNIAVDQAGGDTGGGGCIPPSTGSASQGPQERNPPTRGAFSDKQGNVFIKEILCPNCHREKTLRCEDNKAPVESQQEEDAAQGGASMDASRRDAPDSQAHRGIDKGGWTPNVKP